MHFIQAINSLLLFQMSFHKHAVSYNHSRRDKVYIVSEQILLGNKLGQLSFSDPSTFIIVEILYVCGSIRTLVSPPYHIRCRIQAKHAGRVTVNDINILSSAT